MHDYALSGAYCSMVSLDVSSDSGNGSDMAHDAWMANVLTDLVVMKPGL